MSNERTSITPKTQVCAIIGNPVGHSLSPVIHNRAYRELEIDAVYVPFLVDDPVVFLKVARFLHLDGFSVTLPHKSAIIPLLRSVDPLVKKVETIQNIYEDPDQTKHPEDQTGRFRISICGSPRIR